VTKRAPSWSKNLSSGDWRVRKRGKRISRRQFWKTKAFDERARRGGILKLRLKKISQKKKGGGEEKEKEEEGRGGRGK